MRVVSLLHSSREEPDAVYGVVGNLADADAQITTVTLRQPNLTENTLQVVLANNAGVPIGAALQKPIDANPLAVAGSFIGSIPKLFPLVAGHGVIDGPIENSAVWAALDVYHPLLGQWGNMVRLHRQGLITVAHLVEPAAIPRAPPQGVTISSTGFDAVLEATPPESPADTALQQKIAIVRPKPSLDTKLRKMKKYASTKSAAKGLLNVTLISTHTTLLLKLYRIRNAGLDPDFFPISVTFLISSIIIEGISCAIAAFLFQSDIKDVNEKIITFWNNMFLYLSIAGLIVNTISVSLTSEDEIVWPADNATTNTTDEEVIVH